MKRNIIYTVFFFCFFSPTVAWGWNGYVVRVLDGDSLRVKRDGTMVEIRLYGIDCPEWGQPFGDEARRYTAAKLHGKTVSIEPKDIDRYGRVVALVSRFGFLMNRELVREGLAWMYPRYCKEGPLCSEFKQLQEKARKSGRGLWRTGNPVSPWQWKWENK